HDAINRFEQAQRRASDFKFRVILARDAYNIARTMVNLHERSLIQAKVALMASPTQANQAVYDAVIERLASATFHKGQTGRRFDQEKRAWKAAHEAELKAEENIKMAEEELETAKTIAQSLAGQAWQSAVTSRLSTLSADSASTAALTARVRAIEAGMAVHLLRARVGDPAQVLDVNIRIAELNSNNARARLSEVQRDVEAAAEEYNAAEQANKEALAVFEKVVLARIEASADVIEARKKFDDDDNEAGAAAAAAQIAELAADPDLNPYLLQKLLSIFGYPYLVNDVLDLELFHNPTTTTKAQEDFLTEYKNYAIQSAPNKSWCDWVSPMPVVLVELVVRNSEVYAINVPGLPWLTPAHFIPKSLHYIDDAADQTLPVTLGTKLTTTSAVYEIEQTPYITQVDLIGFPKYDHIVLPDFNTIATSDSKQEFTMDSWNRLPLVGTDETFCDLKEQLEAAAKEAGAENNYYALTEISHDYMMVKNLTTNQINKFILAVLTINREYDNTVSLTVTDSGPFVVNNGVRSKQQLPIDIDSEIFMRKASTENVLIPDADGNQSVYDGPVKVYPNPTVDLVNVEFNLQEKSQVTLKIINAWGNSVYEEKASLLAGWHSKEIDIKKMSPAGLYIISVTTPHGSRMTKVLVE
ncbi:MAG: T9SS type A sorting domain-containing protein, partial [Bacteroidota bacterium]